jgi:hypothetical protein
MEEIKMKNESMQEIIFSSLNFTKMLRVFVTGSNKKIVKKLLQMFPKIRNYETFHEQFCHWFRRNIKTAKSHQLASYGQAAKVIDIAMKYLVYFRNFPNTQIISKLQPKLHCGIDNLILHHHLKKRYSVACRKVFSLKDIDQATYERLQAYLNEEAVAKGLLPVDYDERLWKQLKEEQKAYLEARKLLKKSKNK